MKNGLLFLVLLSLMIPAPLLGQQADTLCIDNVQVIPMTANTVLKQQRVWVANGKIIAIEPVQKPVNRYRYRVIDGQGNYLIPGLSEMHYHFRSEDIDSDFKLLMANGITTVRNMAEFAEQDQIAIRARTRQPNVVLPNYYTTGPYLRADDLATADKVTEMVNRHKARGYDFLKLADNLPLPIYLKLLNECQRNNLPVVGHAQRKLPLEYSLRMKSIEHVEEFSYLSDSLDGGAFTEKTERELAQVAQRIQNSGIYVGTTLVVFDFINNCMDDARFAAYAQDSLTRYVARKQRDAFLSENNDYRKLRVRRFGSISAPAFFTRQYNWIKRFTRQLADHQVNLLTGSDTFGMVVVGFSLHKEFELLQELGLQPYDILLASTVNPARYLNTTATEGTIAVGKNANLVLLAKNPLDDIRNTRAIAGVMVKGHWFDQAQLRAMLAEAAAAYNR